MTARHTACLGLVLLLFVLRVAAEEPVLDGTGLVSRLAYLNTDDGLKNNFIHAIAEDAQGFIWIGTASGLNHFDGNNITDFVNVPGTPDAINAGSIADILPDRAGKLWIASWGKGLYRYEPATGRFDDFRHRPDDPASLPDDSVDSLAQLMDGRIIVGSLTGVSLIDPASGITKRIPVRTEEGAEPQELVHARDLLVDESGSCWIATRSGLFRLEGGSDADTHVTPVTAIGGPASILRGNIITLAGGANGMLVLGTESGLWRLDAERRLSRYTPPGMDIAELAKENMTALGTTRDGNLMIGTYSRGGLLEDRANNRTRIFSPSAPYPYGLRDVTVTAVHESRDGTLWLGTLSNGIVRASRMSLALEHHAGTRDAHGFLGAHDVNDVAVTDAGELLLATQTGMMKLAPEQDRFIRDLSADGWSTPGVSPSSLALLRDGEHAFWAPADSSADLLRIDENSKRIHRVDGASTLPKGILTGMRRAGEKTYWATIYPFDLVLFDPAAGKVGLTQLIDPVSRSPIKLRGFANSATDFLVLGEQGPVVVDERGQFVRWFTGHPDGTFNNIMFADDGSYWLATGEGALHHDKDGQLLETIDTNDGLPDGNVLRVVEGPDGTLWFTTSKGISFRSADQQELVTLRGRDGLQSDVITGVDFLPDGRAVFAGPNGLNIIDPETVRRLAAYSAPLKISSIDIVAADGSSLPLSPASPRIVMQPGQEHVRIRFALLDYADAARNTFEYRVIGSNDRWTPIGNQSQLILQQIEPGDYRLELRGTSAAGTPAANTISLPIVALPHWYESMLAKTVYALLAASPFVLLLWFGIRHTRTSTFLESERRNRVTLESMYQLSTELSVAGNEMELARCCFRHLESIHHFDAGALFGCTNDGPRLFGAHGLDAHQSAVIEALPVTHPRLAASVLQETEPFRFSAEDIDGGNENVAGPYWIGISADTRSGCLALLLASKSPWLQDAARGIGTVFRQAVHALNLEMLPEWTPADNNIDPDTGLLARQGFHALGELALAGNAASHRKHFLLTLRFTNPAGDRLDAMSARQIAWRMVAQLREKDVAGRIGNNTFVVLLPDTAQDIAERIRQRIAGSLTELHAAGWQPEAAFTSTMQAVETWRDLLADAGETLTSAV